MRAVGAGTVRHDVRMGMRRTAGLIAATLALVSCGGDETGSDRPAAEDWERTWRERQALVPERDVLAGTDATDLCGELVGEMRSLLPDLTPTPAPTMQDAVDEWAAHAETIVFECSNDDEVLAEQYEELRILAVEVEAALAASG